MSEQELALFLDTNSLLHYPPIKDVDWLKVCNTPSVTLVLCMQVIHELDEKKSDARLSKRAKRVIKEIRDLNTSGDVIRKGVRLTVYNQEVKLSELAESLSPDSKDDRIVHLVKRFIAENDYHRVVVYTEDYGMMLRCNASGIDVIEPDENTRLEDPQSEIEKKYREAVQELHSLKSQTPKLKIGLGLVDAKIPTDETLKFTLPKTPPQRDIDKELEDYKKNKVFPASPEASEHLDDYRHWLEHELLLDQIRSSSIQFAVWLCNIHGSVPADDIDVHLIISDVAIVVFDAESEEAEQLKTVDPPPPPNNPLGGLNFGGITDLVDRPFPQLEVPNLYGPVIERDDVGNRFIVKIDRKRLKHGDSERLTSLIVVLNPERIRPFQISYRISAANQPQVLTGGIPIIVKRRGSE